MACQVARHLAPAVSRQRIPLRAGSVHFYRRNCLGHAGVDSCGGHCETIATLMNFAFLAPIRPVSLMGALEDVETLSARVSGVARRRRFPRPGGGEMSSVERRKELTRPLFPDREKKGRQTRAGVATSKERV